MPAATRPPEWFRSGERAATQARKMPTATRKAWFFHVAGSGWLRLLPVMRGIWLTKAIGQT
jgi:hypothetical protein